MKIKTIEKPLANMTPAELQKGIARYFNSGSNDPDRDVEINRREAKARQKAADKKAAKLAKKSQ